MRAPAARAHTRLAWALVAMAAVATVLLLGSSLLGIDVMIGTDQLFQHEPWRSSVPEIVEPPPAIVSDTLDIWDPQRQVFADALPGDIALWNPYPSGGAPLAAEPSTGTLGPFQLAYVALPDAYAPAVVKLTELLVAAGFMFLFLRGVGLNRPAAVLGGLVYTFNGFQLAWTNWPQTRVGALVPAVLWATDRLVRRRSPGDVVVLALVVAALHLEGFPAVTVAGLVAAGAWALVRGWPRRGRDARPADGAAATPRRALAGWALAAAGVVLGTGLAAMQLMPFVDRLSVLDLEREQTPGAHLDLLSAVTVVAPDALGAPGADRFLVPGNYTETLSYVGAAACVLAAVGLARRRPADVTPGLRTFAGAGVLLTAVLLFVGGPLLGLAQSVPPLDTNYVGRLRALLALFVAVLAAVGVQSVLTPGTGPERPAARRLRLAATALVAASTVAVAVHVLRRGSELGALSRMRGDLLVALALALAAGAAVAVAHVRPDLRRTAVVALGALVVAQATALWSAHLPTGDRDRWFPATALHDYLEAELDHERAATGGTMLLAGSTARYGIRTVTGHVFTQPTWKEILRRVDPRAFATSPTYSFLSPTATVANSPVLDRLAARYFVIAPHADVIGEPGGAEPDGTEIRMEPGVATEAPVRAQRLRAVAVELLEPWRGDPTATLQIRLRDTDGEVVAAGERLLRDSPAGRLTVPVAAEAATRDEPVALTAELTLDAPRDGTLDVAATAAGEPALGTVSGNDDLELVFADGGQVYRRDTALPRIRWAPRAEVEPGARARLTRLSEGVPDDTVVLTAGGPEPAGEAASVSVVEDGLDRLEVDVDAEGGGYLVVADAVQIGWRATLDGEPVELRRADHALGAVYVPAGRHRVVVEYEPPSLRTGLILTVASLVVLALVSGAVVLRARRPRST